MDNLSTEFNLRPQWNAILDIYKAVSEICIKHNIKFYLGYGSVIGAVRHKGFIPWDDDLDIIMLRHDYDAFLEIADKELPEYFRVVDPHNTPEYSLPFCKIQETREDVLLRVEQEQGMTLPHGIYIDIFPLDGVPTGRFIRYFSWIRGFFLELYMRAVDRQRKTSWRGSIAKYCGVFVGIFFPKMSTLADGAIYQEEWTRKHRITESGLCAHNPTFYGSFYAKRPFRVKCLGKPHLVPYEDIMVPIPEDYDEYLRAYYEDYMTPPPPEKRKRPFHSCLPKAPWRLGPTGVKAR